jgi:hypothetical protein
MVPAERTVSRFGLSLSCIDLFGKVPISATQMASSAWLKAAMGPPAARGKATLVRYCFTANGTPFAPLAENCAYKLGIDIKYAARPATCGAAKLVPLRVELPDGSVLLAQMTSCETADKVIDPPRRPGPCVFGHLIPVSMMPPTVINGCIRVRIKQSALSMSRSQRDSLPIISMGDSYRGGVLTICVAT